MASTSTSVGVDDIRNPVPPNFTTARGLFRATLRLSGCGVIDIEYRSPFEQSTANVNNDRAVRALTALANQLGLTTYSRLLAAAPLRFLTAVESASPTAVTVVARTASQVITKVPRSSRGQVYPNQFVERAIKRLTSVPFAWDRTGTASCFHTLLHQSYLWLLGNARSHQALALTIATEGWEPGAPPTEPSTAIMSSVHGSHCGALHSLKEMGVMRRCLMTVLAETPPDTHTLLAPHLSLRSLPTLECMLRVGSHGEDLETHPVTNSSAAHFQDLVTRLVELAVGAGPADILLVMSLVWTLWKVTHGVPFSARMWASRPALPKRAEPDGDQMVRLSFLLLILDRHLGLRTDRVDREVLPIDTHVPVTPAPVRSPWIHDLWAYLQPILKRHFMVPKIWLSIDAAFGWRMLPSCCNFHCDNLGGVLQRRLPARSVGWRGGGDGAQEDVL
ncbi:MAG: hypothetical protein WDW38_006380 [Sanguina aurantia]